MMKSSAAVASGVVFIGAGGGVQRESYHKPVWKHSALTYRKETFHPNSGPLPFGWQGIRFPTFLSKETPGVSVFLMRCLVFIIAHRCRILQKC
jgi:hypothetical protein